jgi:REP element-mobilizing transposase RayT
MSRPLRIEYEGAYYHVMNRGRGRQAIFHGEEYFRAFLDTLAEAHERFRLEIHAYCLMGNHYHLLLKTPEGNLQRAMRHVGGLYTQRYNRLKKTDGSLFRGRYKAILVDHDAYFLHLSKYIHRNPVDAHIVERLEDYEWSSYHTYIGKHKPEKWLYQKEIYGQLHAKRQLKKKYKDFVNEGGIDERIEDFYSRERLSPILGGEIFIEEIQSKLGEIINEASHLDTQALRPTIARIVAVVSDYYRIPELEIYQTKKGRAAKNRPRKLAMYLAQHKGDHRLTEIAEAFGLKHYGGVSNAIYDVRQAIINDRSLRKEINTIINRFDP